MKVVLLSDVKGLGKKHDIVETSEGYARNFLFPKKLALVADSESLSEAKTKKDSMKFKLDTNRGLAQKEKEKLEALDIEFLLKTHEGGKLFGSVTSKEISEKLKEKYNIEIDKKKIDTKDNIKSAGDYIVKVKLFEGITANLKVKVIGE